MTRPDPHASYREYVSSEAEAVEEDERKWTLHRQPKDQIADHEFSIWCDEHPIVLANEMPGEDGSLAFIVAEVNSAESLRAQLATARRALEEIRDMPIAKEFDYDKYGGIISGSRAYGPSWSAWHFQNLARAALNSGEQK